MSTQQRTPAEQEAAVQAEQRRTAEQVEEAAAQARADAEAAGKSQEDVDRAVERARREEKDKLYPRIEALQASLKDIQDTLRAEREEKENIKNEAQAEAERKRVARLSEDERQREILERLEEQLKEERVERERFRQELDLRDKKDQLSKYRTALISGTPVEYKEFLIEDLVQGDTKEELDAAYARAETRAKEINDRIKAAEAGTVRRGMPRPTNPDTGALEEQELDESLVALDQDKYLKDPAYRRHIQGMLEREYEKASGRA